MRRIPTLVLFFALLSAGCSADRGAAAARARPGPSQRVIPVAQVASLTVVGPRIYGMPRNYQSGPWLVPAGDLNGDGVGDLALADPSADAEGKDSGAVSVILDWQGRGTIDVRDVAGLGFAVAGSGPHQRLGAAVVPAGDVNADGYADLAIGTSPYGRAYARPRDVYVILGGPGSGDVDVRRLGERGFRVVRTRPAEDLRIWGATDWNGDGYSDLLVSGSLGRTYVLFGRREVRDLRLPRGPDPGRRGVVILGREGEAFGQPIASVGDVNGDRLPDIAIGARQASHRERPWSGSTYVVFGTGRPGRIDVRRGGSWGFRIDGPVASPSRSQCVEWGPAVAGGADVNGDGLDDVVVGAPHPVNRWVCLGSIFVVFGKAEHGAVDLLHPRRAAFQIIGEQHGDWPGAISLPDLDGDGLAEVSVGTSSPGPGATHVVFGKRTPGQIRLPHLGRRGFTLDGGTAAYATDLDADGLIDLVVEDQTDVRRRAEMWGPIAYVVPGSVLVPLARGAR